jgi:hypothetical protein
MLHELYQPAFIEVVEKAADISVQNVAHLLLQERIRQPIQRVMLAASRVGCFRSWIPTPPILLSTLRGLPPDRARARLEAERIASPYP